jgi:hypothetical protein
VGRAHIFLCASEQDLIKAWSKWFLRVNPDCVATFQVCSLARVFVWFACLACAYVCCVYVYECVRACDCLGTRQAQSLALFVTLKMQDYTLGVQFHIHTHTHTRIPASLRVPSFTLPLMS